MVAGHDPSLSLAEEKVELGRFARRWARRLLGRPDPGAPPAGDRDRTGQGVEEIEYHAYQLNHERQTSRCRIDASLEYPPRGVASDAKMFVDP